MTTTSRLNRAERTQQIIKAAIKVFARYGYEGASTAQLAESAGITEPHLYRHFSNKEALFLACLNFVIEAMGRTYDAIDPDMRDTPLKQLQANSRVDFEIFYRHPDYGRLMLNALATSHIENIRLEVQKVVQSSFQEVHECYQQMQASRQVGAEVDAWAAAWVYLGTFFSMMLISNQAIAGPVTEQQLGSLLQHVIGLKISDTKDAHNDSNR